MPKAILEIEMTVMTKHIPVLLKEVVEGLHIKNGDTVIDATLGGGGHTRALLERVGSQGKVIALDTDSEAIERFRLIAQDDPMLQEALETKRLVLVRSNFAELVDALDEEGIAHPNAILADLGFSSDQIEDAKRGLSFQNDGPLDMRLDREIERTAADIVNALSEQALAEAFRKYGEETEAGRIARAIVTDREKNTFTRTSELAELIERVYPARRKRMMNIHPATKVFQALRIVVNDEYARLEQFLEQSVERLNTGGRLAVIAFHSGEDRIVKHFFQQKMKGCICPQEFPVCRCGQLPTLKRVTRRPIEANEEEVTVNPRARSAKLRIAEKV